MSEPLWRFVTKRNPIMRQMTLTRCELRFASSLPSNDRCS